MAKFSILAGTTNQTANLFIQDATSTGGAGLTGLTATGVTGYYAFARQAPVAMTLVTTTVPTGVFATGAFIQLSSANMPGWYRLDLPNAALASTNGNFVSAHLFGGTNMAPVPLEIELTTVDNQSSTYGLATLQTNVVKWAGFAAATTQIAIFPTTALTGATNVNVTSWAGFNTATTQFAVLPTTAVVAANAVQWAGFTTATTMEAVATSINVNSWAGFAVATTQFAILPTTAVVVANTTQWDGFSTATTMEAIATSINVNAWGGAPTATNQLALATTLDAGSLAGVWAVAVDGTITAAQSLKLANSANGGILNGATTTAINIRDLANTKNRILASGDAGGNRNVVTLDLT